MSIFSGKCDFYDHLWMRNKTIEQAEEYLKKTDIFICSRDLRRHKLEIKTIKDAAKYYPYIISCGAFSKERSTIELSGSSFIDDEEKDRIQSDVNRVIKYWRKCKRNKVEFDRDKCYKEVCFFHRYDNDHALDEIIDKVIAGEKNIDISKIHRPIFEHMRTDWYDALVELGYPEYEAFCWAFNEFFATEENMKERILRW